MKRKELTYNQKVMMAIRDAMNNQKKIIDIKYSSTSVIKFGKNNSFEYIIYHNRILKEEIANSIIKNITLNIKKEKNEFKKTSKNIFEEKLDVIFKDFKWIVINCLNDKETIILGKRQEYI